MFLFFVIIFYWDFLQFPDPACFSCFTSFMQKPKWNSESGASIIEMVLVFVIASILVTFAIGQFAKARKDLQRQNLSRELKINLERARFDSVKRRAVDPGASVAADTRAWVRIDSATSFTVATDLNMNGILELAETRQISFNDRINASIIASSSNYPLMIKFDQRGQTTITDKSGATIDPSFTVCGINCTAATATANNADVIFISPTGTIAMSPGGTVQPTFQNPTVTVVSNSANIDNRIRVNTSNYPY